jgi:hypothetical protein
MAQVVEHLAGVRPRVQTLVLEAKKKEWLRLDWSPGSPVEESAPVTILPLHMCSSCVSDYTFPAPSSDPPLLCISPPRSPDFCHLITFSSITRS